MVALASQYLTLKKAGADRFVGLCPVPPGEDAVVRHLAVQAALLLPRMRRRRRRDPVHPRAGAPQLRRGGRAAGPAGRRAPAVRGRFARGPARRRAQARAVPRQRAGGRAVRAACSPTARRPPTPATYVAERGISPESVAGVRRRVRARLSRLPAAAAQPATRPQPRDPARGGAGHARRRRAGPRPVPRPGRPSRSTTCRAAASASARASCRPTRGRASRRSTSTPPRPRSTRSTRCSTTCTARARPWRASGRGVRGRGLHRRDRAGAGRHRERRSRRAARRWGRATSDSSAGSPQRAILAFDSDEAGARAAERAFAFQEQFPSVAGGGHDHPAGAGPGRLRRQARRRRRAARPRRPRGRWSSTCCAARSDASRPVLGRGPVAGRRRGHAHRRAGSPTPSAGASTPTWWPTSPGSPSPRSRQSLDADGQGQAGRGRRRVAQAPVGARQARARDAEAAGARPGGLPRRTARGSPTSTSVRRRARKAVAALQRGRRRRRRRRGWRRREARRVDLLARGRAARRRGRARLRRLGRGRGCRSSCSRPRATRMRMQLQKLNPTTDPGYDELFAELVAGRRRAASPATGHPERGLSDRDRFGPEGSRGVSVPYTGASCSRTPEEIR